MAAAPVRPKLGIVTIGQTPRPDLAQVFGAAAPHADVQLAGALDGLADAEVSALAAPGPYPLLVRLADGTTAEIPRDSLVPRVTAAARALADQGAALVVVACAGEFPAIACGVPVLVPGKVVPATVRAVAAGARIGIVTPNLAQVPYAAAKWQSDGFHVVVAHASPARHDEMTAAAAVLRAAEVTLVVLDCMGHDDAYRAEFARLSERPTIAVQTLVAELAGAMV